MADLVLQILSYVAQLERENIKQRQAEGIASARLRGVRFGRPALERPDSYSDVIKSFEGGEVTRQEAATLLNVSTSTFDRWRRADTTGFDRSPSVRPSSLARHFDEGSLLYRAHSFPRCLSSSRP